MTTKVCNKCHVEKDVSEFHVWSYSKDGLQRKCKKCASDLAKIRYKTSPRWRAQLRISAKISAIDLRKIKRDYLKTHPCKTCGEDDPVVLDFHHPRDNKDTAVATMVQRRVSEARLMAEMKKCTVLCANCHRRLHHRRRSR